MKKLLFGIVLVCPVAVWAQEIKPLDIKPGLWESTTTREMSGMTMPNMPQISPEQLAKMPPEARAQIEARMKAAGGAPQTSTMKVCITKKSLSKAMYNGDKSCTTKLMSSTSSTQLVHVDCPNIKSSGDVTIDRVDAEHVKGSANIKATTAGGANGTAGQNMTIKMSFTNKFLSSDCGDVKPFDEK